MRAARLFHEGLAVHHISPVMPGDLANVLMVSALEVLSLEGKDTSVCQECSQPIYRISQRVADLSRSHLGAGAVGMIKDSYAKRSRYLHEGGLSASQPLTAHFIPQLDTAAPEGCALPRAVAQPFNLLEFASYCIRSEARSFVAGFR